MKLNSIIAIFTLSGMAVFAQQKPSTGTPTRPTTSLPASPGPLTINTNTNTNTYARRQQEFLSDPQRQAIDAATAKVRQEQSGLNQKRMALIRERSALEHAENIDETALRAKGEELAKLETELSLVRARLNKELRAHMPKDTNNLATNLNQFRPPVRPNSGPVPVQRNSTKAPLSPAPTAPGTQPK
jgi:hypothetical protein